MAEAPFTIENFDSSPDNILTSITHLFTHVILPALQSQAEWGVIGKDNSDVTAGGRPQEVTEFLLSVQSSVESLREAAECLKDNVELVTPPLLEFYKIESKPTSYMRAASLPDVVHECEDTLRMWISQVERILETPVRLVLSDTAGPRSEVEVWKSRMAKFNAITEQIRGKACKTVLGVLQAAKCDLLSLWKDIDMKLTDATNEAKDNLKYLHTLDAFFDPLYKCNPIQLKESIPSIVQAMRTMHSIARYYNTPERLLGLFVKVTNQLAGVCRQFLTAKGNLWQQDRSTVLKNMATCLDLYQAYQNAYRLEKTSSSGSRQQITFSESIVFGKLDLLCQRIRKLVDLFNTIQSMSAMGTNDIEGMDEILDRFRTLVDRFASRPYDMLDTSQPQFEEDFSEFNDQIALLELDLQKCINRSLESIQDTSRALRTLNRFNKIFVRENLKPDIMTRYKSILQKYASDLEDVRKTYETFKLKPPMPRNFPPIAGHIAWARQLLRAIEEPMVLFPSKEDQPILMDSVEAKRVVKTYNKLAMALVQYEASWHQGWLETCTLAKAGLHAPLLVRHPSNPDKLYVNFDHEILEVMREAKELQRMGLEVPEAALVLHSQETLYKDYYERLQMMIAETEQLTSNVPFMFRRLMQPHTRILNDAINPGLNLITWSSLAIGSYLENVNGKLQMIQELVAKVSDAIQSRIGVPLQFISASSTVFLPVDEAISAQIMVEQATVHVQQVAQLIDNKQQGIEAAVYDVIEMITQEFTPIQQKRYKSDAAMIVRYYFAQAFQSVLTWTKEALTALRKRIVQHMHAGILAQSVLSATPLFHVHVELSVPHVTIRPSLDDIQRSINQTAVAILRGSRMIYTWGQDRSRPGTELKSFNSDITKSKEIVKIVLRLAGTFTTLHNEVARYLEQFMIYQSLWKDSIPQTIEALKAANPQLDSLEVHLQKYQRIERDIRSIPPFRTIGPLYLDSHNLKQALLIEANHWKTAYGQYINDRALKAYDELSEFVEKTTVELNRKVEEDLDDVRKAMLALDRLREMESIVDLKMQPMEDAYRLLVKFEIAVDKSVTEGLESVQYAWTKVKDLASKKQEQLNQTQARFRIRLIEMVGQFNNDVAVFKQEYDRNGPMQKGLKPRVAFERCQTFTRLYDDIKRKQDTCLAGEALFGFPVKDYPELIQIKHQLTLLHNLYALYHEAQANLNATAEALWNELDLEKIAEQIKNLNARFAVLPAKVMKDWDTYVQLKTTLDAFTEVLPLLQMLCNPAVQERHWKMIVEITGHELRLEGESFQLKDLLASRLPDHRVRIEDICHAAVKEIEIESALHKISNEWKEQELLVVDFKHRGPLILKVSAVQETVVSLEDSLLILNALLGNRYNSPFLSQIQQWLQKLTTCTERLELWMHVQSLWAYMEAVFSGGDIARQLPQEAKKFANIDKSWVKVMATAMEKHNVIQCCCHNETLRNLLPILSEQLEQCQKSLSTYLDSKRLIFPRFFFVSDAVLLEILGQGSDPVAIRPHLTSVFDSIADIGVEKLTRGTKIISFSSREGELLPVREPFIAEGNIEFWLSRMIAGMMDTIKGQLRDAVEQFPTMTVQDLITRFPAQIASLSLQAVWTQETEDTLRRVLTEKGVLAAANKRASSSLRDMVSMLSKNLSSTARNKVENLVTMQVHHRDELDHLSKMHVKSPADFEWQRQTRVYWRPERDTCVVAITDVEFEYCYEYLGTAERLVFSPLTERAFITLAQAHSMFAGGAPVGPAGTGKTETVKDMGKQLGKYVVVFNCGEQMNARSLGKLFKGLSHAGCWGNFDEFNRIALEVLSVAAQQVAAIFTAQRERKSEFLFPDGQAVTLTKGCGIFITMNPSYQGRQELPENLKSSFRFVAMMAPSKQIIIRVKLAAAGFQDSMILSKKFVTLYQLCEEQLSPQKHYGIVYASVLKTGAIEKRTHPDHHEELILLRVLRDANLSKLVDEDEPLFRSLLSDVFPKLRVDETRYEQLDAALNAVILGRGLILSPSWKQKLIQLYECTQVRHGLVILGPSGSGKTTALQVLMEALSNLTYPHKEVRLNPKAVTTAELFGHIDLLTNEWNDGIFSSLWRECSKMTKKHPWMVLDGPVETTWMENLNSVLDDNKTLTLANSDRISMPTTSKIVFETSTLINASPSTISRVGCVFFPARCLGWEPTVQVWLRAHVRDSEHLKLLFDKNWELALQWYTESTTPTMNLSAYQLTASCLTILSGMITLFPIAMTKMVAQRVFSFCMAWSIGGTLDVEQRFRLHSWMLHTLKLEVPADNSVHEYFVDPGIGTWVSWKNRVPEWSPPRSNLIFFPSLLVPTADTVRFDFLVDLISRQGKSILIEGEGGSGKTATILHYLRALKTPNIDTRTLAFASSTSPAVFQEFIEGNIDKRVGTTYGPSGNKHMLIFLDDINLPLLTEWGDQPANELLRQLIEFNGMYNLKKPGEWMHVEDIQFIAAMRNPSGGHNDIPDRLKRHFVVIGAFMPLAPSIDLIYGKLVNHHICESTGFGPLVVDAAKHIASMTRQIWSATRSRMQPTPSRFIYVYNLRDLTRIIQGILLAAPTSVSTPLALCRLWMHEITRVLADRFFNDEELQWFTATASGIMLREEIMTDVTEASAPSWFISLQSPPTFVTEEPTTDTVVKSNNNYERIASFDALRAGLMQITTPGFSNTDDVSMFDDALKNVIKIARVLHTPGGNALLMGPGGSRRHSLTTLAAHAVGSHVFRIAFSKSYSPQSLTEDLRHLFKTAGHDAKSVTFFLTEAESAQEWVLERINNLLTVGDIPHLFSTEEMETMFADLGDLYQLHEPLETDTPSFEVMYKFFCNQVRSNLHVVLCYTPDGDKLRSRSWRFPGIMAGCTVINFQSWSVDVLRSFAVNTLPMATLKLGAEMHGKLTDLISQMHSVAFQQHTAYSSRQQRSMAISARTYESFLHKFKSVYTTKRATALQLKEFLIAGLAKLERAMKDIEVMRRGLSDKEKYLIVAQRQAQQLLVDMASRKAETEKDRNVVALLTEQTQSRKDVIDGQKVEIEQKLSVAQPDLDMALEALRSITSTDIAALRKMSKPPNLIKRVMDAVLVLTMRPLIAVTEDPEPQRAEKSGQPPRKNLTPSWEYSTTMLSDSDFLGSLTKFPKETINDETCELLMPYLQMPDFNPESGKKVSSFVTGLITWCSAIYRYHNASLIVNPLRTALYEAQHELYLSKQELAVVQARLDAQDQLVADMRHQYDGVLEENRTVQEDSRQTKARMERAEMLMSLLVEERKRWIQQRDSYEIALEKMLGDVVLATGFVCYASGLPAEMREDLMRRWTEMVVKRGVPSSEENFNLLEVLADPKTSGDWLLNDLPNDWVTLQNAAVLVNADRPVLAIDPQQQCRTWLLQQHRNTITAVSLYDKALPKVLAQQAALGRPVIIDDVDEDPEGPIGDYIRQNFVHKSGSDRVIIIADQEIELKESFEIFMCTRVAAPALTSDTLTRLTVIDFSITIRGLEDQLLSLIILKEREQLELQRQKLQDDATIYRNKIIGLEETLLGRLSASKGSLLEDSDLMEVLLTTKRTAQEAQSSLTLFVENEKKLSNAREEYRSVATRGALLYLVVTDMARVNSMYQSSLKQFFKLFETVLRISPKSVVITKRVAGMIECATNYIFASLSRGIYVKDRLLLALQLAIRIDLHRGNISAREVQYLVRGGAPVISTLNLKMQDLKAGQWPPEATVQRVQQLNQVPQLQGIVDHFREYETSWKKWYESEAPEDTRMPDGFDNRLTPFQRLLVVRGIAEDRFANAAINYVRDAIGARYIESQKTDWESLLSELDERTPVVCLLSAAADPTSIIEQLAKRNLADVKSLSVGQGQEAFAKKLLLQQMNSGGWMILQNGHLLLSLMVEVAQIIQTSETIDPNFRLWITSEAVEKFPLDLLQISVKVTNQAPDGVKAGMQQALRWVTQDMLEIVDRPEWPRLVYTLCFLHTALLERRKYGALGWSVPYEFNSSDLAASLFFLQNHLYQMDYRSKEIAWPTIRYMICEVLYGGRVSDEMDRRVLNSYGTAWFDDTLLKPDFAFFPPIPSSRFPNTSNLADIFAHTEKMPVMETPEMFGLHKSAELLFRQREAKDILRSLAAIQPGEARKQEVFESTVDRLATECLAALPHLMDVPASVLHKRFQHFIDKAREEKLRSDHGTKFREKEEVSIPPLNVLFLRQETSRILSLLHSLKRWLSDIRAATAGSVAVSDSLHAAMQSLYDGTVPAQWTKISFPSPTIASFLSSLNRRAVQLERWILEDRPTAFWLPGFFNPMGFFTAVKQEIKRSHPAWPLDAMTLHATVLKVDHADSLTTPEDGGVVVSGLVLEGAAWEKKTSRLRDPSFKGRFYDMPLIHVSAVHGTPTPDPHSFNCPVYKSVDRLESNIVFSVFLKTDESPEKWVRRGTAMLCSEI